MSTPILQAKNIIKSFQGVRALEDGELTLRRGEIHALMGENGAGKSTLIKGLTGVFGPDRGAIQFHGKPNHPRSPADAEAAAISAVSQEVNLIPSMSIADNIFLGRQPRRF